MATKKKLPVIYQGDDTAANNRSLAFICPEVEAGEGIEIGFDFCGTTKRFSYEPGARILFNYTAKETADFPLGVSYGRLYFEKEGLVETISSTVQILVTDSVERAHAGTNEISLSVIVNTAVPQVNMDSLDKNSSNAELRELVNALLKAINTVK